MENSKYEKEKEDKLNTGKFFSVEEENSIKQHMRFPSKLIHTFEETPYEWESLLFVSDSGNNWVLVIDEKTLECIDVIGSGTWGDIDGSFSECSLYHPQGLALYWDEENKQCSLIICDVKNHKLKLANLTDKSIVTLAGTGKRGVDPEGG